MSETALEAVGLVRRFGARTAVVDLTFSAARGEVVGLLGPNGAGKTTCIRLLSAILAPSAGSFVVDGVPFTDPEAIRRRVGVLPESSGFPRLQTGEDYLRYHARLFGASRTSSTAIAHRLLDEVGLGDRYASLISTYSRGMRQRLGIARALVNEPAVVFLDEPTLGLDPAGQRQVLAMVHEIAERRGTTVLLSSHALAEVEQVCTSLLVLREGLTIASGGVADVIRAVGLPPTARVRLEPADVEPALVLLRSGGLVDATPSADERGLIRLAAIDGHAGHAALSASLRPLVDSDLPILSFEVDGARLSDAFLAMTAGFSEHGLAQ